MRTERLARLGRVLVSIDRSVPDRVELAPGLVVSRVVTGLWQVADMERGGRTLDLDRAAAEMAAYAEAGFDAFDMADHYGSAEDIAGRFNRLVADGRTRLGAGSRPAVFTKWCPTPGRMSSDIVRAAVDRARERLQTQTIDLLQFHWWTFQHPGWLDAMHELAKLQSEGLIRHLGVTNFDTDHLRLLVRDGITVATNQVCFSLLDRRAAEDMTALCRAEDIKLLAYGTLAGGLLSEKWLARAEPAASEIADWSTMKYKRFVDAVGGWEALQGILRALRTVAARHGVSIANVATRWVLEQPAVGAVIVGARLGEREHRSDNRHLFGFALDRSDREAIDQALTPTKRIPGDCGSEYRRPPYLTASGDLSHHLQGFAKVYRAEPMPERPSRLRIDTGSIWEPICGYSRAVRIGDGILVSGTTATHGSGRIVCPGDPHGQTVYVLDKIQASIEALGGTLEDVVRTRIFVRDRQHWEPIAHVHGRYLGHVRPANTLVEVSNLVGEYEVEIETEAVVDSVTLP
jgi:aryl-alcohol dehydrogenase-like predicted oxidoreductase/enamine deaminase RidA (YjgF/YER057c/UK114 family)